MASKQRPAVVRDPRVRPNIHTAGAVLWRPAPQTESGIEVAVIHRPKYQDWSLPKGKLDPGESPVVAAVREVGEETGVACRLGRYLGYVTYPIPGHRKLKRVDYWAARAVDGTFTANDEVDELTWCPLERVMDALSYPMDRQIIRSFARLPADTDTLLLVRPAHAAHPTAVSPPDDSRRPLDARGQRQAAALTPNLLAYGASELHSEDLHRCLQTLEPVAGQLGCEIEREYLFSQASYPESRIAVRERIRSLVRPGATPVFCARGAVITDLLTAWAASDGLALPAARTRKGTVWALSFLDDKLIAADHLDRSFSTGLVNTAQS